MTKVKKFLTRQKAKLPPGFLDQKKYTKNDYDSDYDQDSEKQREEEARRININQIDVDINRGKLFQLFYSDSTSTSGGYQVIESYLKNATMYIVFARDEGLK